MLENLILYNSKTYSKSIIVIKTVWCIRGSMWQSRAQNQTHAQSFDFFFFFLTETPKQSSWGKESLSNKCCWNNQVSLWEKINLNSFLIPNTKINSRQIIALNIIAKTVKLLEETIEEYLLGGRQVIENNSHNRKKNYELNFITI